MIKFVFNQQFAIYETQLAKQAKLLRGYYDLNWQEATLRQCPILSECEYNHNYVTIS